MNTSTGYFYDAKFEEYILTVGQTGCAKTTFVQKLAKSKMFGNIMDDIQGLADKSENFANFLTVSRKFTFVYIFHTIYPTRNNWQMIPSQTKIFNIFPGSIQASSVIKMFTS